MSKTNPYSFVTQFFYWNVNVSDARYIILSRSEQSQRCSVRTRSIGRERRPTSANKHSELSRAKPLMNKSFILPDPSNKC